MMLNNLYIYDCEVFKHDWLFVFKKVDSAHYVVIKNDYEELVAFMLEHPLLAGFNCKHYDQWILKAAVMYFTPEQIKEISDNIIVHGMQGWEMPIFHPHWVPQFDQFDLMDDCQKGLSLKAIEGHLGMDICETTIPFDIDRKLTDEEMDEVIHYCKHDVDATEMIFKLRKVYIENKLTLGKEKGLTPAQALPLTNAKLTAVFLDARRKTHDDERKYVFPEDILWHYVPDEVVQFFEKIHDKSIPDEVLWSQGLDIMVGDCPTRIGWGGIHGAIPNYREESSKTRVILNSW